MNELQLMKAKFSYNEEGHVWKLTKIYTVGKTTVEKTECSNYSDITIFTATGEVLMFVSNQRGNFVNLVGEKIYSPMEYGGNNQ